MLPFRDVCHLMVRIMLAIRSKNHWERGLVNVIIKLYDMIHMSICIFRTGLMYCTEQLGKD